MYRHHSLCSSGRYLFLAFVILSVPCLIMLEDKNLFLLNGRLSTTSLRVTTNATSQTAGVVSSSKSSSSVSPMINDQTKHNDDWWSEYVSSISRVYTPWNGTTPYGWCIPSKATNKPKKSDRKTPVVGLLYVKSPKASSSTCQGVTANIAHNVGRLIAKKSRHSNVAGVPCAYYSKHDFAGNKGHGRPRQRDNSLLWTTVRHPAERDLSSVMYIRVMNGMEPTEENMIHALSAERFQGTQVKYLLPSKRLEQLVGPETVRTLPGKVSEIIRTKILEHYDFIGVTERMDDSLAVLTLLWGLDPTDVVVLSSKQAGGYSPLGNLYTKNGTYTNQKQPPRCVKIPKPNRTRAVEELLQSDAYQSGNADFLLYDAVVASLDRTIDELGRDVVQGRINHIRELQQLAELQCSQVAKFPCSYRNSGEKAQFQLARQSCYVEDSGCGHQCVNKALRGNRTIPNFLNGKVLTPRGTTPF